MAHKKNVKNSGKQFEAIVGGLHRKFSGGFSDIVENAHVIGESGASRQIDVLIRTPIVGLSDPVTIVVECKDYQRPVDIGKVDELIGKIQDAKAVKGILVSNSGFTEGAKERARRHGNVQLTVAVDWREESLRGGLLIPVPHLWVFHEVQQPIETRHNFRFYDAAGKSDEEVADLIKIGQSKITEHANFNFERTARDEWLAKGKDLPIGETEFRRNFIDDFDMRIDFECTFMKRNRYFFKKDASLLPTGFYDDLNQRIVENAFETKVFFCYEFILQNYDQVTPEFYCDGALVHNVVVGCARDTRIQTGQIPWVRWRGVPEYDSGTFSSPATTIPFVIFPS